MLGFSQFKTAAFLSAAKQKAAQKLQHQFMFGGEMPPGG
jgi:hypothetical protein